jgi:MoaA/NifB/PqqE/SkfB family radical SAM enzyme
MQVNILLNNYIPKYTQGVPQSNQLIQLDYAVAKSIVQDPNNTYVLRGEPTLYPYLFELLDQLQGKNFILITHATDVEMIKRYKKIIPYISINYDGYTNDTIRNSTVLTANMMNLINAFQYNTNTILRLAYIINPYNIEWLLTDADIMMKLCSQYSNMKLPYFSIYQQSELHGEEKFTWMSLPEELIRQVNAKGILTQKNYDYLLAYTRHITTPCASIMNSTVVAWDSTVRLCQSHRFIEKIGDLRELPLATIMENTTTYRLECAQCPHMHYCWFAQHYKENFDGNQ